MNHELLSTECPYETGTIKSVVEAIELLESEARSHLPLKSINTLTEMPHELWRFSTSRGKATIENLIARAQTDLDRRLLPKQVRQRLEVITELAQRLYEFKLAGPFSSKEGVRPVEINGLILEEINWRQRYQLATTDDIDGVSFRVKFLSEYCLSVRVNTSWLRNALDILIDNAIEAMSDSPIKELTISTKLRDNGVNIQVKDTGRGIPVEIQPLLLKEPIKKSQGGRGTGLLFAKRILRTYGGKLQVESTNEHGTTMSIWLPLERLQV